MNFDSLAPAEEQVRIGDRTFVLREATEAVAIEWRNRKMAAAVYGPEGKLQKFDGLANLESYLVSSCLTEGGKAVPEAEVLTWPSRIVSKLYDRAMEMSDLDEMTEEDVAAEIAKLQTRLVRMRKAKNS